MPPWQFELRKLPAEPCVSTDEAEDEASSASSDAGKGDDAAGSPRQGRVAAAAAAELDHVYCHVLDWQAPRNYVFVPQWMMRALRVRPREVVELTWVRLREAAQVHMKHECLHPVPPWGSLSGPPRVSSDLTLHCKCSAVHF